ncbi:hypothetical protein IKU74_05560 [bacterium]|nr:hypothetical protein [bacterium]
MSFDFGKLAQGMQKLSKTMLQGTILMAANDRCNHHHHGGMYGPSIWQGGCFGPQMMGPQCGPSMLPLNLAHPFYSSGQTHPYLIQQGMMNNQAYVQNLCESIRQQFQGTPRITDDTPETALQEGTAEEGQEIERNLTEKGEHAFVTERWIELNSKPESTDAEKKALADSYSKALEKVGDSWVKYVDNTHGNKDNKISLSEFQEYIKTKYGDQYSITDAEKIFNKLAKGTEYIQISNAQDFFSVIDLDQNGIIKNEDFDGFLAGYVKKDSEEA